MKIPRMFEVFSIHEVESENVSWDDSVYVTNVDSEDVPNSARADSNGIGPKKAGDVEYVLKTAGMDVMIHADVGHKGDVKFTSRDMSQEEQDALDKEFEGYWTYDPRHWKFVARKRSHGLVPADGIGYKNKSDEWFKPVSELAKIIASQSIKSKEGIMNADSLAADAGVQITGPEARGFEKQSISRNNFS